jgi:hypothetical protein
MLENIGQSWRGDYKHQQNKHDIILQPTLATYKSITHTAAITPQHRHNAS